MTDIEVQQDPRGGAIGAAERQARADALDETRSWVDPNGYQLSDRTWQAGRSVRRQIDQTLREAIVTGESPLLTARKLEQWLSPSWAPHRDETGKLVANQPKRLVTQTPGLAGRGSHAARRLARTEVTRAHGRATIAAAERNPFTRGVRWVLSAGHKDSDACCIAGTMVETTHGPRPIETVAVGDMVLTHHGRYRPVTQLHRRTTPVESLVRLHYQVGRNHILGAVVTRNHPVLTDQGWIEAGHLRTGCLVVSLPSRPAVPPCPPHRDAQHRASRGFDESGPSAGQETSASQQHGEDVRVGRHMWRTHFPGWLFPTVLPMFAFDICQRRSAPRPSLGLLALADFPTNERGLRRDGDICLGAACRSWDWPRRHSEHRRVSKNAERDTQRRTFHTFRTSVAWLRGAPGSSHSNKTSDRFRLLLPRTLCRIQGTLGVLEWPSPEQRTSGSKNDALLHGSGGPRHRTGEPSRFGTTRRFLSYVNYSMQGGKTPPTVEVFNFAVADDNSYFADGIAVHNCDRYASHDEGLGRGVYPVRDVPSYPQHPHERCTLAPAPVADPREVVAALRSQFGLDEPTTTVAAAFVPATDIAEAEAFARSLGVPDVIYGEPRRRLDAVAKNALLNAANVTNEALSELAARGIPLPPNVRILRDPYNMNAMAHYQPSKDTMTVNTLHRFWRRPEVATEELRAASWLVAEKPADVIVHEVGHYLHLTGQPTSAIDAARTVLTPAEAEVGIGVSRYAATNQSELVAEVFVQRFRGRPVSDDAMTLYRRFGGPDL